jgi:uncharacterized protein DUF4832/uncharacterized protein DUF4874
MSVRIGLRSVLGLLAGAFLVSLTFGSVRAATPEHGVKVIRNGVFETDMDTPASCTNANGRLTIAAGHEGQSAKIADTFSGIVPENLRRRLPPPPLRPGHVRVKFLPTSQDFANPERGFMKQSSIFVDQPLDPFKIRALQSSDSLVWVYFRLDNYRDPRDGYGVTLPDYQGKLIDEAGLNTIRSTFRTARSKGLKLVIRFVYNPGPGSTTDPGRANTDAPLDLVLKHIGQVKPLLVENGDVIAAMQAGFVGHWGEWHSSKYLHEHRKEIVDALLAALPKNRMLQVRYPRYKEIIYGGPLTTASAFSGTDASRVGHHNDCFLRDLDDGGTYRSKPSQQPQHESSYCARSTDEISCWKRYLAQEGRFTPVGGETCQLNPPRTDCANALAEMRALHWSYINNDYKKEVLDSWRAGGCMEEIRRNLGYRFVLKEARVRRAVPRGGVLDLDVLVRNEGFASLYNPRPVFLVLQNVRNRYEFRLGSVDPRRWEAGQDRWVSIRVKLPKAIVAGRYAVSLWLPDAARSLRESPSYAVRFANGDVWNATLGLNMLTSRLRVEPSRSA